MQINLLDVIIGAEYLLIIGYLLYGVLRKFADKSDQYSISLYITTLIGFITAVLIMNTTLSLQRFNPDEMPFVIFIISMNIIFLCVIIWDTLRLRQMSFYNIERDT